MGQAGAADTRGGGTRPWWSRLSAGIQRRLGRQPDAADAQAQALRALLGDHAHKLCSAAAAVDRIAAGSRVFVGSACGTPRSLVAALEALAAPPADVELLHFLSDGAVPHDAAGHATTQYRHRAFFVGRDMRAAVRQGLAEYVPMSIARVPQLIANGRIPVDVALVQVSPPDAFGYVSLGIAVDIAPAAIAAAKLVIAELNPAMPRTMGDSLLNLDQIDCLVPVEGPVIEYAHPATDDAVVERIARYIGGIIDDGSTLQIGMGRVTTAALKHLHDRRDLGIHSDVITDAIIPLLEQGVLTGRRKSQQRGKIVTSFAMGTRALYELIDRNPLFSFQPIEQVALPATIAAQHRMVSVTQAFAIDLTGQACVDQEGGEFYGGMAAQGEFLRGASRSEGGKAILCLAATEDGGRASRIRVRLAQGESVSIARTDVHYVVTEYGIAYLFGKSIRERAVALIGIAHPDFRAALFAEAQAAGLLPEGLALRNLHAYAVEEEQTATLADGRALLLRPAVASDADAIRQLFHSLSDGDVYTRFFRQVRSLTQTEVQRLCNVDFEHEVAFVAVTGTREDPHVVAHGFYVIDASTNLAETAFMVARDWQGKGLGKALQQRMAEHAAKRGVRGFVAEILPSNTSMIRLAKAAGGEQVSVEKGEDTVHVTTLF